MSFSTWLPVSVLYPLTSVSDGCLLVAAALATTLGGRPALWGASFALAHLVYALTGAFAISQLNESSEIVGDVLIVLGALFLLRSTIHHQVSHRPGGGCGCAYHPAAASPWAMLTTAFGLSLHAVATGAIARQLMGESGTTPLLSVIIATSLLIGVLVSVIVQIGEWERGPITKFFDKIPGIISGALVLVVGWCSHHLVEHLFELSHMGTLAFSILVGAASLAVAWYVREKTSSRDTAPLVKLSSRKA